MTEENEKSYLHELAKPVKAIDMSRLTEPRLEAPILYTERQGSFVSVRKADEEETRLGVYLGDMPLGLVGRVKDGVLHLEPSRHNPAIWVPELNQIVYGCESWWGVIETPDDLRKITSADINDTWYVKALRELGEHKPAEEEAPTVN